jgi:hypothetical protein
MGSPYDDIAVEGKDGVGLKTDVPWCRFYSKSKSDSATRGWYCVYLFPTDGKGVYLCLAHGSSRLENGSFVPRDNNELKLLTDWGKLVVKYLVSEDSSITPAINLHSNLRLANSYEKSIVAAKYYSVDSFPSDSAFTKDALSFAKLLQKIYYNEDMGRAPDQPDAIVSHVEAASSSRRKGQGFNLTGPQRKEVELRAMDVAKEYLLDQEYTVSDVSMSQSCDFLASKAGVDTPVEVKGTTSSLGSIVLTFNEVELHKESFPNNMLIVVTDINLDKSEPPAATGGTMHLFSPWEIDLGALKPISYEYKL